MLKIRLKRVGRKHDPSYRVVVTEKHRGPKSGKYIEKLGHYDARTNIKEINADRVKHWISVGAQVSPTVHNLLVTEGILDGKKKNVLPKKNPIIKEQEEKQEEKVEEKTEIQKEEAAPEEAQEEKSDDIVADQPPTEDVKEEAPVEEVEEEVVEESKEDTKEETK